VRGSQPDFAVGIVERRRQRRLGFFVSEVSQRCRGKDASSHAAAAKAPMQFRGYAGPAHAFGKSVLLLAAHKLEDFDRNVGQDIVGWPGLPYRKSGVGLEQFEVAGTFKLESKLPPIGRGSMDHQSAQDQAGQTA
jgi:hypothetical protein